MGVNSPLSYYPSHETYSLSLDNISFFPFDLLLNEKESISSNIGNLTNLEGGVESLLMRKQMFSSLNHNLRSTYQNSDFSRPLTLLLNSFRSDWEGNFDIISSNNLFLGEGGDLNPENFDTFFDLNELAISKEVEGGDSQFDRSSAKNLIVSSNAIGKVFKSRYDDHKSLARLSDFSELEGDQPLISGTRVAYERILNKISESKLNIDFFVETPLNYGNEFSTLINFQNFPLFDFPFLLANKSEAGRHL